jgi:hypothetical protein
VGLRIVEAPPEYYEALSRLGTEGSEAATVSIEISTSSQVELQEPPEVETPALEPEPASPPAVLEDADVLADGEDEWIPLEFQPAAPAPASVEDVDVGESRADEPPEDQEGWIFAPDLPSDALMIDDGELDDVHALLVELGASPVREHADPAAFRGWAVPPRLLVVSASCAARLRVPPEAAADRVVTVAVAEADSLTLRGMLRRQGFQYVVRRPVHPEALRLLLMRVLYRGREQRSVQRLPFGHGISWRTGWAQRPGMLTEISVDGCRVLCPRAPELGSRLTIRIPRQVADGRALSLTGCVVRRELGVGSSAEARDLFAVRFEDLSRRAQPRLAVILQEREIGPATLPGRAKQERAEVRRPGRLRLQLAEPRSAKRPEAVTPPSERRGSTRGSLVEQVVALDPDTERVKQVLFGRDLSIGGMRIEPHPELALGDRIRLALYEPSSPEAILLDATVHRDDRELGLALRFDDLAPEVRDRLERMISELPSIDGPVAEEELPKPLVVAEIVSE